MNEPSPYQPPLQQDPPPVQYAVQGDPPVVKVLGILHLVFAGFGVIGALWGLFIAVAGNPFLKMAPSTPHLQEQFAMQARIQPMSLATSALSLLVAIPMITAGVLMLKKRKSGLKWSNIYACSSLGAKVVNLVLTLTIVIPATNEMTRKIMSDTHAPDGFSGIMSGSVLVGMIGGVLVSCVYPVLSLVLLNRPAIKTWFAGLPR
jgi:hypothetical protein